MPRPNSRIRAKRAKMERIHNAGAVGYSRCFVYANRNGKLRRFSVELIHLPCESETRAGLFYLEKLRMTLF